MDPQPRFQSIDRRFLCLPALGDTVLYCRAFYHLVTAMVLADCGEYAMAAAIGNDAVAEIGTQVAKDGTFPFE